MKKICLLKLLFAVLILGAGVTAASSSDVFENGVLVLDQKTYDQAIENNKLMIVEFFAPWW